MRYIISYVSDADPNLKPEDISDLLEKTLKFNTSQDINGFLLFTENNFFQLIEGDEEKIKELYFRIENDTRHTNIIKFIEKPVSTFTGGGYICEDITGSTASEESQLEKFLPTIEKLDPSSKTAVKRVFEAVIIY